MRGFRHEDDICRVLADANLAQYERQILATVKPAIEFVRRQKPDKSLALGASKIGGCPDIPKRMAWPTRPSWSPSPGIVESVKYNGSLYSSLWRRAVSKVFPLAFFAQLDLDVMALQAGFDIDLPDRGMLYVFEDITAAGADEAYQILYINDAIDLVRHDPPEELITLSDAKDPSLPFAEQQMCEALEPYSLLTIPNHWLNSPVVNRSAMWSVLKHSNTADIASVDEVTDKNTAPFGDRLGGWPEPIQQDPEVGFRRDRSRYFEPGDDEVRHLFSWAGEYFSGTGLMHHDLSGDGATYLMMRREDLLARRFEAVTAVYQCT
ncbi:DUF1963 domain-containing protein [Agrobacterium sp. rho-8.1]|nr:DUF1963 domain-containing protein [Agrobacterium sp. rho-8.1]